MKESAALARLICIPERSVARVDVNDGATGATGNDDVNPPRIGLRRRVNFYIDSDQFGLCLLFTSIDVIDNFKRSGICQKSSNGEETLGQPILETMLDWEGDVEELARLGGRWCAMLRIENHPDLTVRLVRDYAQRGILDRPRREGKAAIYGWEHLVRLLAARLLLREGWPLQKIADELTILSFSEIRALLPGSGPTHPALRNSSVDRTGTDPALDALRAIRSRGSERPGAPSEGGERPAAFRQTLPITDRAALQQDLAASRRELGEDAGEVPSRPYTRLEIANGVELHLEIARLRSLGRAEAYAIARAVLASLLNPRLRKEEKPE